MELSAAKIQIISAELLITFTLSVHVKILPNKLFKGVLFLAATSGVSVAFFPLCFPFLIFMAPEL